MDYALIKVCHLVGVMLIFLGLGGMVFAARVGLGPEQRSLRRAAAILHGIGLLLLLVSGIAMLSQLGFLHGDPPNWAKAKFGIFLLLGGSIALAARASRWIWVWIPAWVFLGAAAAYLALEKPF
jgi:uncharacterized membrane protein SirB2